MPTRLSPMPAALPVFEAALDAVWNDIQHQSEHRPLAARAAWCYEEFRFQKNRLTSNPELLAPAEIAHGQRQPETSAAQAAEATSATPATQADIAAKTSAAQAPASTSATPAAQADLAPETSAAQAPEETITAAAVIADDEVVSSLL